MFKKLLSAILSVGMCLSLASVTVLAETISITGWENSIVMTPSDGTDVTEFPLGVEIITDSAIVPSGTGALHVYGTKDLNNYSANAVTYLSSMKDGAAYRLTGKFNVSRSTWRVRLMIGNKELIQLGKLVGTDNLNKWTDVDYVFTYIASTYGNSKDFKLQVAGNGTIYADDLSLKEVIYADDGTTVAGYGEELLANGDFEADFVKPDAPEYVSVASRNGANYIAVKTVNDAVVYAVGADGTQTKLELGDPAYKNDTYRIKVLAHTGLVNNKTYRYIVKAVGSNGVESDGIEAFGTPLAAYDDYIIANNWSYKNSGSNYGTVAMLKGIGTNGSAGMLINNMSDSSANNTYQYICNRSKIALEKDKIYKLSFMAKADTYNALSASLTACLTKSYSSADGVTFNTNINKSVNALTLANSGEWTQQVCYFKAGAEPENTLELRVNRHFENLALDDFALYEVDENLDVAAGAQNLLGGANCDFESFDNAFSVSYKFYPAYGEDGQFGEIMVEDDLAVLSDLAEYETDVLYIEAGVKNNAYANDKQYTLVVAVYDDGRLYDVKTLTSCASYLAEGEKASLAYKMPDMTKGDFAVKAFVLDGINTILPLSTYDGITE